MPNTHTFTIGQKQPLQFPYLFEVQTENCMRRAHEWDPRGCPQVGGVALALSYKAPALLELPPRHGEGTGNESI